jgi:hypothetical protein
MRHDSAVLQLNKGLLPEGYRRLLFPGAFGAGLKYGCNIIATQWGSACCTVFEQSM